MLRIIIWTTIDTANSHRQVDRWNQSVYNQELRFVIWSKHFNISWSGTPLTRLSAMADIFWYTDFCTYSNSLLRRKNASCILSQAAYSCTADSLCTILTKSKLLRCLSNGKLYIHFFYIFINENRPLLTKSLIGRKDIFRECSVFD